MIFITYNDSYSILMSLGTIFLKLYIYIFVIYKVQIKYYF